MDFEYSVSLRSESALWMLFHIDFNKGKIKTPPAHTLSEMLQAFDN